MLVSADCWFIRIHEGIPKDMRCWDYMGNRVADLFTYGDGIGELVHDEGSYQVRRLTLEDWNRALKTRLEEVHMDSEDMFLLDWSAPGDWFVVISW